MGLREGEPQAIAAGSTDGLRRALEAPTRPGSDTAGGERVLTPSLTLLWHADLARVGDRAWLPDLDDGRSAGISRQAPLFASPERPARPPLPLADPAVSRRPIRLVPRPAGLAIEAGADLPPLEVDGERVAGSRLLSDDDLERGVVLLVGRRVALLLQRRTPQLQRAPDFGLVGESAPMARLRQEIARVADLDHPVLLRGATGTGKELVARAIQAASRRRDAAFLTLNLAAVPASLAAAELFGVVRGAFSGAERSRDGYFARADGGTLFLDEIGEAPHDLQAALLRVLEQGEAQPVGGERPRRVDVRVIAATDADLESRIAAGGFAAPLLHRLRGLEIRLPSLAERREDVGRLVLHFLRGELSAVGEADRLEPRGPLAPPFVPARLVARLALHDWPGNVRELRNEVRQLVVASRGAERLATGGWLAASPAGRPRPAAPPAAAPPVSPARRRSHAYRDPSDVGAEELAASLAEHGWSLAATAAALGVSRPSLYALVERDPALRKAPELGDDEMDAALARCGGSVEAAARDLRVSKQALKRQLRRLAARAESRHVRMASATGPDAGSGDAGDAGTSSRSADAADGLAAARDERDGFHHGPLGSK